MKKWKKLLALLPVICMASCNATTDPYGRYYFLMGKVGEGESHIEADMYLTKDKFTAKNKEGTVVEFGEEFKLTASFSMASMAFGDDIAQILENGLDGYFELSNASTKLGQRVKIGTYISQEHFPFIPDWLAPFVHVNLDPEIVQYVLCGYINNTTLTVQIPVSLEDLKYQLCWYGYFLDIDISNLKYEVKELDQSKLPGEKGEDRFGTHPRYVKDYNGRVTVDEATEMNDNFMKEFSQTNVYDRFLIKPTHKGNIAKKVVTVGNSSETKYYFYIDSNTTITNKDYFCYISTPTTINIPYKLGLNLESINKYGYCEISYIQDIMGNVLDDEQKDKLVQQFTFRDYHGISLGLAKDK